MKASKPCANKGRLPLPSIPLLSVLLPLFLATRLEPASRSQSHALGMFAIIRANVNRARARESERVEEMETSLMSQESAVTVLGLRLSPPFLALLLHPPSVSPHIPLWSCAGCIEMLAAAK